MTTDYNRIRHQKEMMWKEINEQCRKYDKECIDYPTRQATPEEISDMLAKSKKWMCSYT